MKISLARKNANNAIINLEDAINQRETKREYLTTPLSLSNLGLLLYAGLGIRGNGTKQVAPSAQEQYPISAYVVSNNVSNVEAGLYKYENTSHSIEQYKKGLFSDALEHAALGEQPWVGNSAVIVILAGNIQSMNEHFSEQPPLNMRGERYSYIEAGAVAQNIQLQGAGLNVGMVLVGGFSNIAVQNILELPKNLEPAALICMGNV